MTWFEAPWWGCHGSDVGLSFFRIEYAFLMNDLIGTVVDGSAQSIAESMRIGGVTRSRLDLAGVSKRQRGEPACACGGGKLGETGTELAARFWPIGVIWIVFKYQGDSNLLSMLDRLVMCR